VSDPLGGAADLVRRSADSEVDCPLGWGVSNYILSMQVESLLGLGSYPDGWG